jgi:hypothetical protein
MQAGSIYEADRAIYNLNFWGCLGLTASTATYLAIPRPEIQSPNAWNLWLAPFVWACLGVAATWTLVELVFSTAACQTTEHVYDAALQECRAQGTATAPFARTHSLSVLALTIAAGLLWRSLIRRRRVAAKHGAA